MEKSITSVDGTLINYDIHSISKRFIIFLHGAGGDLSAWKKIRDSVHLEGYSSIAVDLRGHGKSDRPKVREDYLLDNFAKDVHHIIQKENVKVISIVGHCFGGIVTIIFHKLYPEDAQSYVLIDTTYQAPKKMRSYNLWAMRQFAENIRHNNEKKHANFDSFVGTGDMNIRRISSDIKNTSLKSWLFTLDEMSTFDGTDILQDIRKPVLIIQGEKDTIFNVDIARKIHELTKHSELVIIPNENHVIVINNPGSVSYEINKFLKKQHRQIKI